MTEHDVEEFPSNKPSAPITNGAPEIAIGESDSNSADLSSIDSLLPDPDNSISINSMPTRPWRRKSKEQFTLMPAEQEAAKAAVKLRARHLDVGLKNLLTWVVIIAVGLQLIVSDVFLLYYVIWSDHQFSETVIVSWLSASVIEIIGIVAIIARNLFPSKARRSRHK